MTDSRHLKRKRWWIVIEDSCSCMVFTLRLPSGIDLSAGTPTTP